MRWIVGVLALWLGSLSRGAELRAALPGPLAHTTQATLFSCGHSCLDSALRYWGKRSPGQAELIRQMGSSYSNPPSPEALAAKAREFGLDSSVERMTLGALARHVREGETVIVMWYIPSLRTGHYTIATAIEPGSAGQSGTIEMMDPWYETARRHYALKYFLSNWHKRGTVFQGVGVRISGFGLR